MDGYVYGVRRPLPADFAQFTALADTVAVSIDLHEGHLSEDPDCPCPAPRGREIVAGVDAFHRAARALGVPVVHVKSGVRPGGEDDIRGLAPASWRWTFPLHAGPIPGIDRHAIAGTRWTTFCTEVAPGDLVIDNKKRLTAFYPTDLDFLLRSMGTKRIVFTGCMTDCCILNSAFDAANLGYRITVLADLTRGTDETLEAAALAMMSLHLGVVTTAADLLAHWRGEATAIAAQ